MFAPLHQPREPAAAVAVVVVVALPLVAETVARDLVAVAEVVPEHRQVFPVRVDAQRQPARPQRARRRSCGSPLFPVGP
jgi:hypothetical protein